MVLFLSYIPKISVFSTQVMKNYAIVEISNKKKIICDTGSIKCGFELTNLIVLLIFQLLHHNDIITRHHRLFGVKILKTYCWEKNQPAKFDETDCQTLPIKNFSLYLALLFRGHTKRLCPDPVVGLGVRLPCHLCSSYCSLLVQLFQEVNTSKHLNSWPFTTTLSQGKQQMHILALGLS